MEDAHRLVTGKEQDGPVVPQCSATEGCSQHGSCRADDQGQPR